MARDIFNKELRIEAKKLWDFLETHPDNIKGYYGLCSECREITRHIREPLDTHKEFINKLKDLKIPYPHKNRHKGCWYPYPKTKNQMEIATRGRMKRGDKYQTHTVQNALIENTYLPALEMNIQDAMRSLLIEENLEDISKLVGFKNNKILTFKKEVDAYDNKKKSYEELKEAIVETNNGEGIREI